MRTVNSALFTVIKNHYKSIFSGKRHLNLTPEVRAWILEKYNIEMSPETKKISMESVYKNIYIGAIFAITHETDLNRRKQLISIAAEKMANVVTELFRLINPDKYDINIESEYSYEETLTFYQEMLKRVYSENIENGLSSETKDYVTNTLIKLDYWRLLQNVFSEKKLPYLSENFCTLSFREFNITATEHVNLVYASDFIRNSAQRIFSQDSVTVYSQDDRNIFAGTVALIALTAIIAAYRQSDVLIDPVMMSTCFCITESVRRHMNAKAFPNDELMLNLLREHLTTLASATGGITTDSALIVLMKQLSKDDPKGMRRLAHECTVKKLRDEFDNFTLEKYDFNLGVARTIAPNRLDTIFDETSFITQPLVNAYRHIKPREMPTNSTFDIEPPRVIKVVEDPLILNDNMDLSLRLLFDNGIEGTLIGDVSGSKMIIIDPDSRMDSELAAKGVSKASISATIDKGFAEKFGDDGIKLRTDGNYEIKFAESHNVIDRPLLGKTQIQLQLLFSDTKGNIKQKNVPIYMPIRLLNDTEKDKRIDKQHIELTTCPKTVISMNGEACNYPVEIKTERQLKKK